VYNRAFLAPFTPTSCPVAKFRRCASKDRLCTAEVNELSLAQQTSTRQNRFRRPPSLLLGLNEEQALEQVSDSGDDSLSDPGLADLGDDPAEAAEIWLETEDLGDSEQLAEDFRDTGDDFRDAGGDLLGDTGDDLLGDAGDDFRDAGD
jgi:hypothetical protein